MKIKGNELFCVGIAFLILFILKSVDFYGILCAFAIGMWANEKRFDKLEKQIGGLKHENRKE